MNKIKREIIIHDVKKQRIKEYIEYSNKYFDRFILKFNNKNYKSLKKNISEYERIKKHDDDIKDMIAYRALSYLDKQVKKFFASNYEFIPGKNNNRKSYSSFIEKLNEETVTLKCIGKVRFKEKISDPPEIKYPVISMESGKFYVELIY